MPATNSKKRTVLFVDDSKLMRRAAKSALSNQYDVRLAEDGAEALEAVQAHDDIEAIITDLSMPEMDGYELIDRIKASHDSALRELPILVVTGSASDEAVKQVQDAGAAGLMTKPFKPEALVMRVGQLLASDQEDATRTVEATEAEGAPICIETSAGDLERRLRQTVALHVRHDLPLTVMQLSIANLDEIEAEHNERVAQSVMKFARKILARTLRDEDSAGQTRRDAFTLVLPMTDESGAQGLSSRLEQAFRKKKVAVRGKVIELEMELATCDSGLSAQDIECIAAGKDQPGMMANVIKFELPRTRHPGGSPESSHAAAGA